MDQPGIVKDDKENFDSDRKTDDAANDRKNEPDIEFDAEWYLRKYPDIEQAVRDGRCKAPIDHYLSYGRQEGRLPVPPKFDASWYAMSYPLAVKEAKSSQPEALELHYREFGRHRGYIPFQQAKRSRDPAGIPSAFGGLWIDHANARDLIRGKHELCMITQLEMEHLDKFVTDGYVVLEAAIPAVILDRAEQTLDDVYDGRYSELRYECHRLGEGRLTWDVRLKDYPAKVLDLHWFLEEIRAAGFAPTVTRFLHLIFERAVLASQSLGFYRGSGQEMHQDSAYVPYTLPRQFAAAWIALEDVTLGAGELMYFPKSHRHLPEFFYNANYKSVSEAKRAGVDPAAVSKDVLRHTSEIEAEAARLNLSREVFLAKRGDVLIWHSDLAHGGRPISTAASRKSLVFHYSPKEIPPLFAEQASLEIRTYRPGCFYTSGIYR